MASQVITKFKAETAEYNQKVKEAKKSLDDFGGALSLNVGNILKFGTAIAALKGAFDLAKTAFQHSDQNLDNWERTVRAANSVYSSFLYSLNNGDISGFLGRINQIRQAAKDAYDELDNLGTLKIIDNPRLQAQQSQNERMRLMLRSGRYIAPTDGSAPAMAEGTRLSRAQQVNIKNNLEQGVTSINSILLGQINQSTKTIQALYRQSASEIKVSEKEFIKGTSSIEEYNKRIEGYQKWMAWNASNQFQVSSPSLGFSVNYTPKNNPYDKYKGWADWLVEGDLNKELNQVINDRAALQSQYYSGTAQAFKVINKVEGEAPIPNATVKVAIKFDPNSSDLSESQMKSFFESLSEPLGLSNTLGLTLDGNVSKLKESITGNKESGNSLYVGKSTFKEDADGGMTTSEKIQGIVSGVSSIAGDIQQLGIKLPEGLTKTFMILQVMLSIISTISGLIAIVAGTSVAKSVPIIGTFLAGGGLIHAAGGYRVPGNYTSGDMVPAMLNSGELVLNKAQQGVLASQLSGGIGRLNLTSVIRGEDICLVMNNVSRRRGHGEYITSR